MVSLDLDSLRAFVAAADTSSFSRAGERVGRTQSAVSLQLARLEKILGKTLIIRRQGRVLGLTDDGRELLHYARQLIALNDAAYRAVAHSKAPSRVRLGVPTEFVDAAFFEIVKEFREAHGSVEVELVSDVSRRLLEQAQNGVLDVAFFKQFPGQGAGSAVCRRELTWVSAPNARLPQDGEPIPLILFPEGSFTRSAIFSALEAAGRYWRVTYSCPSLDNLTMAIRLGIGFGVLPRESLAADGGYLAEMDFLPVGDAEVAMIHGRTCSTTARALAERISRYYSENTTKA